MWPTTNPLTNNVDSRDPIGSKNFIICALEKSCDPAKKDMSCCTLYPKCGLGQGHCHHDTVCEGNLVCGNKNCGSGKSKMNCCKGI